MIPLTKKSRQAIKKAILILTLIGGFYLHNGFSQEKKSRIDYSIKSNILNPDTLKGDQKVIFWHFVKLTHEQAEEMKPLEIKAEFAKLGILTTDKSRFQEAFLFFRSDNTAHKKSCEQWEFFKDLSP
ncbi:MAG: hypothetical protein A2W85_13395 [Bacteroidetes bacterium GWF2_41_31]|nr:MAG: hypothetical protein A2W85_13395 [Bacteroidetes bacterium GWF2_41_31]OFZ03020.1 MAG: hypothetical protein A2338_04155 [Bacteroidetes bacterium RIFOXYB12_FULL_41_6]